MTLLSRARSLPYRSRLAVIVALAVLVVAVAIVMPPFPQVRAYHLFADTRAFWGIANFNDVISNLPFLAVGVWGLVFIGRGPAGTVGLRDALGAPFGLYFIGVALVAGGSAYYHLDPTNQTLFWDRLPMTIAFMALFSAVILDRVDERWGLRLLPVLITIGIASVVHWSLTEAAGRGDLRPYAVVQFFPMLAIPLICILFSPRRLDARYVVAMGCLYGLAKVFEHFDHALFDLLGGTVSGHSLKHLAAAAAAYMALPMLKNPVRQARI
jgi:hypothetical protein